jgi:hypothetical protein
MIPFLLEIACKVAGIDDQMCQQQADQGKNKIKSGVVENELAF